MKVLFLVYEEENHGGNFLRAFSYARGLARLDCKMTIISARPKLGLKEIVSEEDNVKLVQLPDIFPKSMRTAGFSPMDCIFRIFHFLKNKYDLVHTFSHRPSVSFPALLYKRITGTPVISDWADLWGRKGIYELRGKTERLIFGWFDNYWERRYRQKVSGITVITKYLKEASISDSGLSEKDILLLPVGASYDLVIPKETKEARKSFGLPSNKTILVYTSLNEYDTAFLIESFSHIAKEKSDIILLVAGVISSETLNRIEHLELSEQVICLGVLIPQKAREVISCGEAVIIPYRNNDLNRARFPNRFSDCISAGRPIITNNTGDLAYAIREDQIGLIASENPIEFSKEVLLFLEDRNRLRTMGLRARELANSKYSIYDFAQTLKIFYKEFI